MVVIVDGDQVAQLEMAGGRSSLASNTLHCTAITKEDIGVVIDQVVTRLVENTSGVGLRDGKTDCIGEALSKRTSCDLNTRGVVGLRVARSDAVNLLSGVSKIREREYSASILESSSDRPRRGHSRTDE